MLMRYIICVIAFCNPLLVVCMQKERPKQQPVVRYDAGEVRHDLYTMQYTKPLQHLNQSSCPIPVPITRKVSQSAFDKDGSPSGEYWELLSMSEHDTPPLRETLITNSIPVYRPADHINTATEPGWERLHEIEHAPYRSNLASPIPVYYSPQQTLQQSYAPQILVNTNTPVLSHDQPRRNAYDKALILMKLETSDTAQKNVLVGKLYECVHACSDAKQYGIDEDQLGRFAYIQEEQHANKAALLFCILKRHNETLSANQKKEKNVSLFDLHPLYAALELPKGFVEEPIVGPQSMRLLLSNLYKVRRESNLVKNLVAWLYSNDTLKQDDKTFQSLEKDWIKLFMYKAFSSCAYRSFGDIDLLLTIIEKAKKQKLIRDESELGDYALEYKPNWQEVGSVSSLFQMFDSSIGITHEDCKYMISLLCHMIKNYNKVRKLQSIKINPTVDDLFWYRTAKDFGISFPDRFKEFNSALEAFDNFINNVATLFATAHPTSPITFVIDKEVEKVSGLLFPREY